MFGSSLHIAQSGTQLVITNPAPILGIIVVGFFLIVVALPNLLYVLFGKTTIWGGIWRLLLCAGLILLLGIVLGHSRVTLNGDTDSATIEQTYLYRHTQQVIPLSAIDHARVADSNETSAVQLIMTDGSVYQLSDFNQQGNKEAAAMAINRFLQSHRRGESSSN